MTDPWASWLGSTALPMAHAGQSEQNPHPSAIRADNWRVAEQAADGVLRVVRPTAAAEGRRIAITEYVKKVIRKATGNEVFPFGSVPLKTYLPDGDIDLTAFVGSYSIGVSAREVRSALEIESKNKVAEFEVRDVQFIDAEVKLVKCMIQNIIVDISFNQIGGLCTLCFLEEVDHLFGQDHLFKRSVILIKSWCYYESRILGAYHGLISTYGLEILVLYIFRLFQSTLDGPLKVLYRFLDYFSEFDWENYCISLNGPVPIASLPDLLAEPLDCEGGGSSLVKEELDECVGKYSVPPPVKPETRSRVFSPKHLNIVDPLKENNNLGRSVGKGNFYRILSAFSYGARRLGSLLLLPQDQIADEMKVFFESTLDRHKSGERADLFDGTFLDGYDRDESGSISRSSSGSSATGFQGILLSRAMNTMKICDMTNEHGTKERVEKHSSIVPQVANVPHKGTELDSNGHLSSVKQLVSPAADHSTYKAVVSAKVNESSSGKFGTLGSGSSCSVWGPNNGKKDEVHDRSQTGILGTPNATFSDWPLALGRTGSAPSMGSVRTDSHGFARQSPDSQVISPPSGSNATATVFSSNVLKSGNTDFKRTDGKKQSPPVSKLLDLTGYYNLHQNNLLCARRCLASASNTVSRPDGKSSPAQTQKQNALEIVPEQNKFSYLDADGKIKGQPFSPSYRQKNPSDVFSKSYPATPAPPPPPRTYGMDEALRPYGTGSYIPNPRFHSRREKTAFRHQNSGKEKTNSGMDFYDDDEIVEDTLPEGFLISSEISSQGLDAYDTCQYPVASTQGYYSSSGFMFSPDGRISLEGGAVPDSWESLVPEPSSTRAEFVPPYGFAPQQALPPRMPFMGSQNQSKYAGT